MYKFFSTFAWKMEKNNFTSDSIRPLSSAEVGQSAFTDYTILSDTGHNIVYKAMRDGKWWVLKAAKQSPGETTRNLRLLQREYDIMHEIDSIYVVRAIQMVNDEQIGHAILMEYVDGCTLNEFIAHNPSNAQRQQVLNELLEVLIYLHQKSIIHGDLKPDNVLIATNGNHVRLIDFGFSDSDTYAAKNIGVTAAFAPPEVINGHETELSQLTNKDIYAFGALLRALYPHRYQHVAHRCMRTNVQCRYSSMVAVQRAIQRVRKGRWLIPICLLLIGVSIVGYNVIGEYTKNMPPYVTTIMVQDSIHPSAEDTRRDSVLQGIEATYRQLYALYADSIQHVPDSSFEEAFILHNHYAARMYEMQQKQLTCYPEYNKEINTLYLSTYSRDYRRLANLFSTYPFTKQ